MVHTNVVCNVEENETDHRVIYNVVNLDNMVT